MTQAELAEILDVSQQFLSAWKNGHRGLKSTTASRWSIILNVDFKILMTCKPDPKIRSKLLGLDERKGGKDIG